MEAAKRTADFLLLRVRSPPLPSLSPRCVRKSHTPPPPPSNRSFRILDPVLFVLWSICEPLRLHAGFVGNVQEKVPELVGYWFFTLLPQLPINIYFLLLPQQGTPLDRALAIIMLFAHFLGFIRAWFIIRELVKHQQMQLKFDQAMRQQSSRNVALA